MSHRWKRRTDCEWDWRDDARSLTIDAFRVIASVAVGIVAALLMLMLFAPRQAHAQVTTTTAKLHWTATGDDSLAGRATSYDLRYSTAPITAANFLTATRWAAMPLPAVSGARDSVTVTGLIPSTIYYFALKIADEVPNWSGLSNILLLTTTTPPDITPPSPVNDLRITP